MNNTKEALKKLAGNRGFISLLALAVVVVTVMAIKNKPAEKTATQIVPPLQSQADIPEKEIEVAKKEATVQTSQKTAETDPEPSKAEVVYKLPLQGEMQRGYFTNELMWDETMEDWRTHQAVDITCGEGDEIDTAAPGTVTEARLDSMCGYVVSVDHGDGVVTIYKNLDKIVVAKGDTLDEGQMIGTVGQSYPFEMAQKPHLHYEATKDGESINPLDLSDKR